MYMYMCIYGRYREYWLPRVLGYNHPDLEAHSVFDADTKQDLKNPVPPYTHIYMHMHI